MLLSAPENQLTPPSLAAAGISRHSAGLRDAFMHTFPQCFRIFVIPKKTIGQPVVWVAPSNLLLAG